MQNFKPSSVEQKVQFFKEVSECLTRIKE